MSDDADAICSVCGEVKPIYVVLKPYEPICGDCADDIRNQVFSISDAYDFIEDADDT